MWVSQVKYSRNPIVEEKEWGGRKDAEEYVRTQEENPCVRWTEVWEVKNKGEE